MTPGKLTGYSLSACVNDIIHNRIPEGWVERIEAGTAFETTDQWERGLAQYKGSYWTVNPDRGEKVARRLIAAGKVDQPRLQSRHYERSIAKGHWEPATWYHLMAGSNDEKHQNANHATYEEAAEARKLCSNKYSDILEYKCDGMGNISSRKVG